MSLLAVLGRGYGRLAGSVDPGVQITISPRVKGLTWNGTTHSQDAAFGVSASTEDPIPAGYTTTWSWSGDGLTFDDPHAQSTTAHASGPGQYYPTCGVHAVKSGVKVTYDGSNSKNCFAIGGPITTSIPSPQTGFYDHDKNSSKNSWYLTNYNYSHAKATPTGVEST